MAEDLLTSYQCPNCNGPLHFDAEEQKLKCDSCGTLYTVEEIQKYYTEKNSKAASVDVDKTQKAAAENLQWTEEEKTHLRAYNCPSCGAQLITDAETAATSCPYCGNPTVVPSQFEGSLKPDSIIPFKLIKEDAVKNLKNYYHKKPFLPKEFSEDNHIEEIKGVYVPFWLYDSDAEVHLQYDGSRTMSHIEGDYNVTVTEHYLVRRDGTVAFNMVPADASSKMPDDLMDSIEPFNYEDLQDFSMSYLPGYLADRYDVSSESDADRADLRMRNTALDSIKETAEGLYMNLFPQKEEIIIHPDHVHYVFLPVWMLSTQWNGKHYLFAMNGQTGKLIGDLPVDRKRFWMTFALIAGIGMIVMYILLFIVMGGAA